MSEAERKIPNRSAFREGFLELLRLREEAEWAREAELQGRWYIETHPKGGYALLREEESLHLGDRPTASARNRSLAQLLAAILPAVGRERLYRLEEAPSEEGFAILGQEGERAGYLRHFDPEIVTALHLAACLVRSPDALATLLEAAGPTAAERVGVILARRVDR